MLVNKQDIKYTLWFDVEERYKTMKPNLLAEARQLWFDVEERYKTIVTQHFKKTMSCGLM